MRFCDINDNNASFKKILKSINSSKYPVNLTGICEAAEGHLISSLCEKTSKNAIVICYTDMEAAELYKEISFYQENAYRFPSKEMNFYNIDASAKDAVHKRLRALYSWRAGGVLVTSVDALFQYTISKEHFENSLLDIKIGDVLDIDELKEKLVLLGYKFSSEVDGIGLFSSRGGIIDVYSPNMKLPVRIEFFDDEVDSIRTFDWETQRSVENVPSCTILPCLEALLSNTEREKLTDLLSELSDKYPEDTSLQGELEKAKESLNFPSIDKYIKDIYGYIPSVIDYAEDSLVFIVDTPRIKERFTTYLHDSRERIKDLFEKELLHSEFSSFYGDSEAIKSKLFSNNTIFVDAFGNEGIELRTKQTVSFHGKVDYLYDELERRRAEKNTIVILSQSKDKAKNLCGVLKDKEYDAVISEFDEILPQKINIIIGTAKAGFEYPDSKFVLISDKEIFEGTERRVRRKIENTKRIKSYNEISVGDYVVHRSHGIGTYAGIHKMMVKGITKDYLKVVYKNNDILYVPVEQLDMLYKYSGGDSEKVKINRLGGKEWSRTTAKVKKSTADMAKQLVSLYAARANTKGFAYGKDTVWQRDFEDSFIYTETEDQIRSIEEVKADMESEKPMDRLLCGDVGFGKTEIALRAAFKAVMDSKQVAYLCPTTILALQHFNTFSDRMREFPIRVEMLSRFRTPTQQRKILAKLKKGEIDILIGTHRILQKDVEFSDLGLLIIDEEQRFGVAHKESLKELKKNIDVLSMTATPIPRTLHMSMISVRDMSVLTMPPQNRHPVQTYVLENNPDIICSAVALELSRGGQVFYLYNRVQGIYKIADFLQKKFPNNTVRVGHGQMSENELEDIMHDMVTGATDILVCTTIIETGLDIPNANTIIIDNADKMGLSQLYQLRGRVGRSNRKAYAYLVYQRDKMLSEVAGKRLQAIKEFTEFGSGFKIALKDLEIRGAGDILGSEQHGHMDSVGYDMYCRILKESMNDALGIENKEEIETSIDISVDAYIPEKYIYKPEQRIDVYKKISAIETEADKIDVEDEITDRFGDIPRATRNIIRVALLKAKASRLKITEITQRELKIIVKFESCDISRLIAQVTEKPLKYKLIPGDKPALSITLKNINDSLNELEPLIDELLKEE